MENASQQPNHSFVFIIDLSSVKESDFRLFCFFGIMANEQNLIPQAHVLTVEEQSRGGKRSGEIRSLKSLTKQWAEAGGYEEMVQVAKDHLDNPRFWEMLASLLGEGPTQKVEAEVTQNVICVSIDDD